MNTVTPPPAAPYTACDVLIVGAGPAGSAAAFHAANRGYDVLLIDAATFPRDKTCGDGLTPRAMHELAALGVAHDITSRYTSRGLKLHGFGGSVTSPWPTSPFGTTGSAMPRTELDDLLRRHANAQPAVTMWDNATALTPETQHGRITAVTVRYRGVEKRITCRFVIVADGVRSPFGKKLGRTWHKGDVYGIAARSYCTTPLSHDPWIHSHLELRDSDGVIQPGYGWIFPLGNGSVNLGCGALSTDARPAKVNTKKLLELYASQQRAAWSLGQTTSVASALLPMGGAVSNVSGPNWALIGDAAACVNPLNGEGIDYGLETARMAVGMLDDAKDLTLLWPYLLRSAYGNTFLLARTLARVLTYPRFLGAVGPVGFRGPQSRILMPLAVRLMGNLVTDSDRDLVARTWHAAGRARRAFSHRPLWESTL